MPTVDEKNEMIGRKAAARPGLAIGKAVAFGVTAIATGLQQVAVIAMTVWGTPVWRIQYIGLAGSVALVVAAVATLGAVRAASLVVMLALALLWVFYAPALWATIPRLSFDHRISSELLTLMPACLLVVSTGLAWVRVRST
jgi:hypothetical protein